MEEAAKKRKARLEQLRNVRQRSLVKNLDVKEVSEIQNREQTVEKHVEGIVKESIENVDEHRNAEELDLSKAIQTKPDSDLKRLLMSKLEPLEIENQRAIIELIIFS
ncbi:hypothetical protein BB560_003696 [Smittium megazygosporum]|uniref:Uncharacterized protein n=1 Tax=Smittium megazygosporum TaxID=133381 RepID=A0A2T9ZBB3_9FUNG|nr:hypothetical protein BB560_003696 [Smittium megazygosporum]